MRRNHALWLAPLLAVFGLVSYYALFARWPITRDVPWANFAILALAFGLSLVGLRRAWPRGLWRRIAGVASLAVCTLLPAFLAFYTWSLSYGLPDAEGALAVGETVPAARLLDQTGREVDLESEARGSMLLVFYRGHW